MDAILTAGGIPQPDEPLFEYTQGEYKALLDVAGRPMIQWVLDALEDATTIDRVLLIGLPPDISVSCRKTLTFIPSQGGLLDNIRTGVLKTLEINPGAGHVLLVSSDIPAVTAEIIDWTTRTALETDHDIYYNLVSRQVMEARFPGSKRSFTNLKGISVCGGDMNVIHSRIVTGRDDLWQGLIAARKNVFKQASLLGFDTLLLLLLRLIDLKAAERRVSRRLGIRGRAILCPYAEIAMDIDKPHQLEILRADLQRRSNN